MEGYKIGPLLAEDSTIAGTLIAGAAQKLSANEIIVDVPETNLAASRLAESIDLKPVFETARMYRGDAPVFDHNRLFGITTLELG